MALIPNPLVVLAVVVVPSLLYSGTCEAVPADTWDSCNCTFEEWQPWEDCSLECFGQRVRERGATFGDYEGCDDFSDCATNDDKFEWGNCNTVCHNNGVVTGDLGTPCSCANGYHGLCCTERVDCGTPESITNGNVSAQTTDYGSSAVYTCEPPYNVTNGDEVRYCQNDFTWNGTVPECIFAGNCTSSPCMNGATCVNLFNDFRCDCAPGWNGRLCDIDEQPLLVEGCSADVDLNATMSTVQYTWSAPVFTDPMGTEFSVETNYETPDSMFTWGDHTVQYTATKLLNSLQTNCSFQVRVRPTPCDDTNIPVNGARICNTWRTDYGRYCMMTCLQDYSLGPSYSFQTWRVCGASGSWVPSVPFPDCTLRVYSVEDATVYQPEYQAYVYQPPCQSPNIQDNLKQLYIDKLRAHHGLASICNNHPEQCVPENVDVACNIDP